LFHKTSLPLLAPAAPRVQQAPKPPVIETSCSQAAQQPHGTKRSLPRLAPAAPRVQEAPNPLIIETSCDQQRTGCDQSRLYPKRKKLAPPDPNRIHYLAEQALTLLQQDLDRRVEASNAFPPHLSPAHIRSAVARYEEDIERAGKRAVCSCCGRLLHITDIHEVGKQDARLRLLRGNLDLCGRHEHTWNLCSTCLTSLSQQTIPKFSAKNSSLYIYSTDKVSDHIN
jgi:hypothetical protein